MSDTQNTQKKARFNVGRLLVWGGFAALLIVAPLVFPSSLALTVLSQVGYMVVICLSYNMLMGQGGMLSFGHAVYSGLGSFLSIHALNLIGAGTLPLPVSLIPVVGGLAGAAVAALLGWVSTKKAANTFAMITLGVGELVVAMALMFPQVFGGEGGISTNRVAGKPFFGVTFGPQIQVYYLIAVYCFVCTAAMFMFTRTPLGRMLNAARDNPERVEFVGYNTQVVRYQAFIIAGFFAGIGGGLMAINFEIVTAEAVGGLRSAYYLLFTYLGGAMFFFGPIIGALLAVLATVLFSEVTKAWLMYLGLLFMMMVMFAPGGLAGLIMMNLRVAAFGKLRRLLLGYLGLAITVTVWVLGAAAMVEMVYHLQLEAVSGNTVRFLGLLLDTQNPATWLAAAAVFVVGFVPFEWVRRRFKQQWSAVQEEIEHDIQRKGVA